MEIKEIVGLDLPDAIESLRDFKNPIKIGSADGTAFFYVGTVADFAQNIDKVSSAQRKHFERQARKTELSLMCDAKRYPVPKDGTSVDIIAHMAKENACNLDAPEMFLHNLVDLGRWASKICERRRTAAKTRERLQNFKPLRERYVKDAFYADEAVEPTRTLNIIINGYEFGNYWTTGDAKTKLGSVV